jgi:hypothetical protein
MIDEHSMDAFTEAGFHMPDLAGLKESSGRFFTTTHPQPSARGRLYPGYDGPGLSGFYESLGECLEGAHIECVGSHSIGINQVPHLSDIGSVLSLYEGDGEKRIGLAVMVHANSQSDACGAEKRRLNGLYELVSKIEGMDDCSTVYTPFNTNKEVVDKNRQDEKLTERMKGRLVMSYMHPDKPYKGYHVILIDMEYIEGFPEKVKELFEKMGAKFNGHLVSKEIQNS